jgi:hypothetical protein
VRWRVLNFNLRPMTRDRAKRVQRRWESSEGDLWSVADEAAVRRLQTLDGVRGEGLLLAQRHHHRRAIVDVDAASGLTAESVGARLDLCGHALRSRHWGMRKIYSRAWPRPSSADTSTQITRSIAQDVACGPTAALIRRHYTSRSKQTNRRTKVGRAPLSHRSAVRDADVT